MTQFAHLGLLLGGGGAELPGSHGHGGSLGGMRGMRFRQGTKQEAFFHCSGQMMGYSQPYQVPEIWHLHISFHALSVVAVTKYLPADSFNFDFLHFWQYKMVSHGGPTWRSAILDSHGRSENRSFLAKNQPPWHWQLPKIEPLNEKKTLHV